MKYEANLSIVDRYHDRDLRERLANLRVLVADRDLRTAKLVKRILFSFGLRNIELTSTGKDTLNSLRSLPHDILITEWDMGELDGLTLVREIRAAREDKRIRRDIPIIMLTGHTSRNNIQLARDAGINEFIAKPFSAKAVSNRIIQIIDKPRAFVATPSYAGPCRRRTDGPPPGVSERRNPRKNLADNSLAPPDFGILSQLGVDSVSEIINDKVVEAAQVELVQAGSEFVSWAQAEILQLHKSYAELRAAPSNAFAQRSLADAAYAIKTQAGIFGYHMGTEVSSLLVDFFARHTPPNANHLVIIGKHIDVISVVFNFKIEQSGQQIARDLIDSLGKLVMKLE